MTLECNCKCTKCGDITCDCSICKEGLCGECGQICECLSVNITSFSLDFSVDFCVAMKSSNVGMLRFTDFGWYSRCIGIDEDKVFFGMK
ncbi:hypothetical protein CWI36_0034p0080, partial [Hamiltosporidium magnivora]